MRAISRPAAGWLVAVWLLALWLIGFVGAGSSAATRSVSIGLDPAADQTVTSGSTTTVTGSVHNTGSTAIDNAVVHLAVSGQLLDTPNLVDQWFDGRSSPDQTEVGTATVGRLEPGVSAAFTVQIPAAKLNYHYQLASLPMTMTVTSGAAVTAFSLVSSVRTTLEMTNGTVNTPIRTTVVIPLTLPADAALFGPSGSARDQAWTAAIGPGSRIDQLLTAFADEPVTWLVDPTIVDPPAAADPNLPATTAATPSTTSPSASVTPTPSTSTPSPSTSSASPTTTPSPTSTGGSASSASGSGTSGTTSTSPPSGSTTSTSPTSSPTSGTGDGGGSTSVARLAADVLSRLQGQASTHTVWWLPYGDPDLVTLSAGGANGNGLLSRMLGRGLSQEQANVGTRTIAWPAADAGSARLQAITRSWQAARSSAPVLMLPTRSATDATSLGSATRRVTGTSGALLYDEGLSRDFATSTGDAGLRARRMQADTLALFQQAPSTARSLILVAGRTSDGTATPNQLAGVVSALGNVPWLRLTSGADALAAISSSPAASLRTSPAPGTPYPSAPASPIKAADLVSLDQQRRRLNALGTILVAGPSQVVPRERGLDSVGSNRWRGNLAAYSGVVAANDNATKELLGKVRVNPGTQVNLFADSGRVTITLVNELDQPVNDVQLFLQPRKYLLRVPSQPQVPQIPANARVAIRADVVAVSAGRVTVDALLTTPEGFPLGTDPGNPVQLQMNVRPTSSWIYWVLGIVAGLVLLGGTLRSIRRGRKPETITPGGDRPTPAGAIIERPARGGRHAVPDETDEE